jgi:hypothetical protein
LPKIIVGKQIKKPWKNKQKGKDRLLPHVMSPPKPKASIKARATLQLNRALTKKNETNAAAAETRAEMNRSTYPRTAAQIPPPPRQSRCTGERTRARMQNPTTTDRMLINKTTGRQRTLPTTPARDSPTETNEVAKSRRFI